MVVCVIIPSNIMIMTPYGIKELNIAKVRVKGHSGMMGLTGSTGSI